MANGLGHGPQAPVRCTLGARLQRLADGVGNLVIADLTWRTGTRLVVQPIHTFAGKPPTPHADGMSTNVKLGCDLLVAQPIRRSKHDPRSHRQRLRGAMLAGQRY